MIHLGDEFKIRGTTPVTAQGGHLIGSIKPFAMITVHAVIAYWESRSATLLRNETSLSSPNGSHHPPSL
jgi:hypothetical protein